MKKVLALLFCFVYLLSSAGVHINVHYCGGKIKSVSFLHSDEADCCGRKMMKKNCCKEKSINVEVKTGQSHAAKQVLVKPAQVTKDIIHGSELACCSTHPSDTFLQVYSEPPDIVKGTLFLSIRVLRI